MHPQKKYSILHIRYLIILMTSLVISMGGMAQFKLNIHFADKDNSFNPQPLKLQTSFANSYACADYINGLRALLGSKGYPTASVDSVFEMSTYTDIKLFLGKQYRWIKLKPEGIEKPAIDESGFVDKNFSGKLLNMQQLQQVEERVLKYYENNGYPFAAVFLDNILLNDDKMDALLKVNKGPLYHLDSIKDIKKIFAALFKLAQGRSV
jgi:outer membrane protein assembly factor BamA